MIAVLEGLSWEKFAVEAEAAIANPDVQGIVIAAVGDRE